MNDNNKKAVKYAVYIAILSTIGFILNFIQIPYIIAGPKFDLSEVVTLIATSLSLFVGIFVSLIKTGLMIITGTTSGYIGELTLLIASFTMIFVYYICHKILKINKILSLIIMSLIFTILMTILNYFFITPFYFNSSWQELKNTKQSFEFLGSSYTFGYTKYIIFMYVPFNLIKALLDSVIFYYISKKLDLAIGDIFNDN